MRLICSSLNTLLAEKYTNIVSTGLKKTSSVKVSIYGLPSGRPTAQPPQDFYVYIACLAQK